MRIEDTPLFTITLTQDRMPRIQHRAKYPNENAIHTYFKTRCNKRGYVATHFSERATERKLLRELPLCAECRKRGED